MTLHNATSNRLKEPLGLNWTLRHCDQDKSACMAIVKMHLLSDAVCDSHGECEGRRCWWWGVVERWWVVWRLSAAAACPLWLSAIDPFYTQRSIAEISPFDHKPSLSAVTALDSLHVFTWGFHNGTQKPMWWHINLTCSQSLSLMLARVHTVTVSRYHRLNKGN